MWLMDEKKILDCYLRGKHRQSRGACSKCEVRDKCIGIMSYIERQAMKADVRAASHAGKMLRDATERLYRGDVM